jgi:hypothetical protein
MAIFGTLSYLVATDDNYRTNVKYLIWKQGWTPNDWHRNYHLFLEDSNFEKELIGKPLMDLKRWFPELVPANKGTQVQREYATENKMADDEFVWVGKILEGFRLRDGRYFKLEFYDHG